MQILPILNRISQYLIQYCQFNIKLTGHTLRKLGREGERERLFPPPLTSQDRITEDEGIFEASVPSTAKKPEKLDKLDLQMVGGAGGAGAICFFFLLFFSGPPPPRVDTLQTELQKMQESVKQVFDRRSS